MQQQESRDPEVITFAMTLPKSKTLTVGKGHKDKHGIVDKIIKGPCASSSVDLRPKGDIETVTCPEIQCGTVSRSRKAIIGEELHVHSLTRAIII